MYLSIDEGNTRTKFAVFEHATLIYSGETEKDISSVCEVLIREYSISHAIFCSVRNEKNEALDELFKANNCRCIFFTQQTSIPVSNEYGTPESLGKDRLAASIGAYSLYPNQAILVVDAGTAITFDFISEKGIYKGGCISPGLEMRFKALHTFTKKLPLIYSEGEYSLLGKSTETAIRSGVINGMTFEIDGYINQLKEQHPNLLIFLTGGNCFFFESKLKNSIFANQNLVLIGLNSILIHNVENIQD